MNIIVLFIDKNKKALEENAKNCHNFSDSKLYKTLQQQIVDISGFKGKDATLSARKAINQFVKIGFIYPLLVGYNDLVKTFIRETNKEKRKLFFRRYSMSAPLWHRT